jgi:hypothetical protein
MYSVRDIKGITKSKIRNGGQTMNQVTITLTQDHPCDRCGCEVQQGETICQACRMYARAKRACSTMSIHNLQTLQKEIMEGKQC